MTHEQLQDAHIAALREIVEQRAEVERLQAQLAESEKAAYDVAGTIEGLKAQLATAKGELEHWTHDSFKRRETALREALQGILDIGKRDMSNPKYDGYFETAREALREPA